MQRHYAGQDLVLVGVLKGAIMFMTDLARQLPLPLEMDFMAVSSYGNATKSSGVVRITKDLDGSIEGRNVLVVEDVVDSGLTLRYLLENLRNRNPASLRVCALLNKRVPRKADVSGGARRLRDPRPLRGRLRAGLRRELPQSALHRRAPYRRLRCPLRRLAR